MHPSLEWMKDHVYFSLVLAVCKACIAYHRTVVLEIIGKLICVT